MVHRPVKGYMRETSTVPKLMIKCVMGFRAPASSNLQKEFLKKFLKLKRVPSNLKNRISCNDLRLAYFFQNPIPTVFAFL